jgi:hypothetical protein
MITNSGYGEQREYSEIAIGDVVISTWTERGVTATLTGRVASVDNGAISTVHGTILARENGGDSQILHVLVEENVSKNGINHLDVVLEMERLIEDLGAVPAKSEDVRGGEMVYLITNHESEVMCYEGMVGALTDGLILTPEGGVLFQEEKNMNARLYVKKKKGKATAKKPAAKAEATHGQGEIDFQDISSGDHILCEWVEGDVAYSLEGTAVSMKDGRWRTNQGITIAAKEWTAAYERLLVKGATTVPEGWIRKSVNAVNPGELTLTISKVSDATLTREGIADKVTAKAILTSELSVLALDQGEEAYVLPQHHATSGSAA